ncbi:MAG: hypothetical protein EBR09_09105 [Proteobacteria bacterium]|nr:hypothetical protein [Pseudomonadota bacterium]
MLRSGTASRHSALIIRVLFTCLFVFHVTSLRASAEDLVWNSVTAQGSGDGIPCTLNPNTPSRNNVVWSAAGGDLSIILTTWGVSLPKLARFTGGKLTTSTICNFTASVTIPRGYYLRTLTQTLVVGVKKDRLVTGGISSNGYLFQTLIPLNQINLLFRPEQALNSALMNVTNTQIMADAFIKTFCQTSRVAAFTTQFKFQLVGGAARPFPQLGLQANVDGSDVNFGMDSSLERCPD